MRLEDLAARAAALARPGHRAILGITGCPGAGKSTLAEWVVDALPGVVGHVPMDGFHLADLELERLGRRDRKGAPDTFDSLGYAALLRRLQVERDAVVYAPGFDRDIEQPIAGRIPVPPSASLVVTEGNYLLLPGAWTPLRELLDEVWYCDLDDEERMRRLISRHERFGKPPAAAEAWARGTDEHNAVLIRETRDSADLIVPSDLLTQL